MIHAFNAMSRCSANQVRYTTRITSRAFAQNRKQITFSAESKKKMSISHLGKPNPSKGKSRTAEQKENIRQARINQVRSPHSDLTRHKMSEAAKGRTFSPQTLAKMSAAAQNRSEHDRKESGSAISKKLLTLGGWWNNGIDNMRSKNCPSNGWEPGMVKRKSHRLGSGSQ
jgi:hypothetical protein